MSNEPRIEFDPDEGMCDHVWDLNLGEKNTIGYRCVRCGVFRHVADVRAFANALTPEIPQAELFSFIRDVEQGRVALDPCLCPSQVRVGPVEYRASNGWTVVVFNDRDSWDYFERFQTSDGRLVTFATMPEAIRSYRPDRAVAAQRYRFGRGSERPRLRAL